MRENSNASQDLVDHVVAAGKPLRVNAVSESTVATLVAAYYARVPSADLAHRTPDELYWLAANHVRLAATRPLGGDAVEVTTPPAQDGPPSLRGGNTLITIVTDDVAMLFDSLIMELTAQQRGVHVALHPQISVLRDSVTGVMESVATQREASDDRRIVCHEAWIQIEIERETNPHHLKTIEHSLRRVITDVRKATTDEPLMLQEARRLAAELDVRVAPGIPEAEISEAKELLNWLADGNFTFLGYRQYELTSTAAGELLHPVPSVGLGVLGSVP